MQFLWFIEPWKFNIKEGVARMAEKVQKGIIEKEQAQSLEISEKQIEIFARRLLPEIKKFFANEDIRKEFEEWKKKRRGGETK